MNRVAQLVIFVVLFHTAPVFAASADAYQTNPVGAAIFVAFGIAYLSRRRKIGGWLLCFYIQMYISSLFLLLSIPQLVSNLKPSNWNNALLYVMFLLSVVPVFTTELVEMFAATRLLFRRAEATLKFLRWTLVVLMGTRIISMAIDLIWFNKLTTIMFDVIAVFFAIVWCTYFWKNPRAKAVFIDNNWVYESQPPKRILTEVDKNKRRKRVLWASFVTFVVVLMLTGFLFNKDGKPPDARIFVAPIFFTLIAAIIAWGLRINRTNETSESVVTPRSARDN